MNRKRSVRLLRWVLLGCGLVAMSLAACADRPESEIRAWAQYWVDCQNDTLAFDSLSDSLPDSTFLDSLAQGWTTEEWLLFWSEVDRAQGEKSEAVDTTRASD